MFRSCNLVVLLTGSRVQVLRQGKETFQISTLQIFEVSLLVVVVALVSRKMQCGELSRAKRARVLSQNQIREIVTNSDDEKKHYASTDAEDNEKPQPPSRLPVHSLQAQIFPPAALKMRMMMVMWKVNSHIYLSGHCLLNPEGV